MINRKAPSRDEARVITVGYSVRVMNKLTTQAGPFNLFDQSSPGAGSGLGQLDRPTGIATGPDGTIYVLNAANARIDRYAPDGTNIGIWNGQVEEPLKLSWNGVQGGTGLEVGPDGLVYIADTWNHAVVVVSPDGKVVRVLGNRGVQSDITDAGSPDQQPGLFFGPRNVAVTAERICVTDTGNERVQVFAMDGTFITAFGGFGEGDGQFVEPTGIAVAPDGTIWVADSGNARLQQFDAEGGFIASYPVPEWDGQQGINRLNLLAFDDNGILYFTVPYRGVWAWHDGERVQLTDNNLNVGGLTFASDGTLLVTDMETATVLRLRPEVPEAWLSPDATPQGSPEASPQATTAATPT
jgi:sugar lactone lactonase YvrE